MQFSRCRPGHHRPSVEHVPEDQRPRHRLLLAGGLFLLAPLVGEYLFGNIAITGLAELILLAPLYGAGALLIREVTRRSGRGWPTMLILALAYGLYEEGPVDQMLWNPHYGGFDIGLAYSETHVGWLGTSVQLLQDVVSLHTVWSICVPIALIEALDRGRPRPWLGRVGLTVVAAVFVTGSAFLAVVQIAADDFIASPAQYVGTSVVIVMLVVLAFVVGSRSRQPVDADAPSPWVVGAVVLAATSLGMGNKLLLGSVSAWWAVTGWFVIVGLVAPLLLRWSRRRGWGGRHRLALAGGALLTYVWLGFDQSRYLDVSRDIAVLGNVVFGLGAIALLAVAWRRAGSDVPADVTAGS